MKKLLCLALAAMLCLALVACAVAEGNWKIAILTGTTSQGEEEFRAAERAQKADPEHIVTDTYPDNFMAETETTISKLIAFASDPDVKAIVMCQAVPGAKAAFDKIRAMGRDDMLLIAGVPQEDPAVITAAADFVLYTDEPKQGDTIMETCAKWGIDVFVHYSFPRHLAMETIAARKALLEENAAALLKQQIQCCIEKLMPRLRFESTYRELKKRGERGFVDRVEGDRNTRVLQVLHVTKTDV